MTDQHSGEMRGNCMYFLFKLESWISNIKMNISCNENRLIWKNCMYMIWRGGLILFYRKKNLNYDFFFLSFWSNNNENKNIQYILCYFLVVVFVFQYIEIKSFSSAAELLFVCWGFFLWNSVLVWKNYVLLLLILKLFFSFSFLLEKSF